MKNTGVVRKIDRLGRLVIPMEIRKTFKLDIGVPIEFFIDGDHVVLKKYKPGCSCCGDFGRFKEVDGLRLCEKCLKKFNSR